MRIHTWIENDESMVESLPEIASDEERNSHPFEGVDDWKRVLRIRAGVGPENRNLQRKRFWELLEWVGVPMNDVE